MHSFTRPLFVLLLLALLLAGCQGQAVPTVTPAPTLNTTALAESIAADIFGTLTAEPTATATDAPAPTATPSPAPDTVATSLAAFEDQINEQATALAESIVAQIPTGAPTLDVPELVSTVQAGVDDQLNEQATALAESIVAQIPTGAPTLDVPELVSTVQVAVLETLVAQVDEQQNAQATQQAALEATQIALESQPAEVDVDDDPAKGPEDASVVIIEFSDFTCPHCGTFARDTLPQLLDTYGDRVRFVFRDAPILGPNSGWTALAAECADDQGKFWEYHDVLFANQGSLTREQLTAFAEQVGLDVETFDTCVDNQTHIDELRNDLAAAQSVGLTGTPTFFINGRRLVGAQPFEVFAAIIEEELAAAGQVAPEATEESTPEAVPSPTATPRS